MLKLDSKLPFKIYTVKIVYSFTTRALLFNLLFILCVSPVSAQVNKDGSVENQYGYLEAVKKVISGIYDAC